MDQVINASPATGKERDKRILLPNTSGNLLDTHRGTPADTSLQKNGAVVRRAVGYRRYEGLDAATVLARLYASLRLFVKYQPPMLPNQVRVVMAIPRPAAEANSRGHPLPSDFTIRD